MVRNLRLAGAGDAASEQSMGVLLDDIVCASPLHAVADPSVLPDDRSEASRLEGLLDPLCFTVAANASLLYLAHESAQRFGFAPGQGTAGAVAVACLGAGMLVANYKAILPFASYMRKKDLEKKAGRSAYGSASRIGSRLKGYLRSAAFALSMAGSLWLCNDVFLGSAEAATNLEKPGSSFVAVSDDKGAVSPETSSGSSPEERFSVQDPWDPVDEADAKTENDGRGRQRIARESASSVDSVPFTFVPRPTASDRRYSLGDLVEVSESNAKYVGVSSFGNPFERALLDTIGFAERMQYNTIYGHATFSDFSTHPNISRMDYEGRFKSDAAGMYGIMGSTYSRLKKFGLFSTGFWPVEQDRAAHFLYTEAGVTSSMIKRALITGNFGPIAYRLARIWPSLPADPEGRNAYCEEGTDADTDDCRRQVPHSTAALAKMLRASYHAQLLKEPSFCGKGVAAIGDSLTSGDSYVSALEDMCGIGIRNSDDDPATSQSLKKRRGELGCDRFACEGKSTSEMAASFDASVLSGGFDTVIIQGGINDISGGASADSVKANLAGMYAAARYKGLRVVGVTLLPAGGSEKWTLEKQAALENVNEWILKQANVDVRVDAYSALLDTESPDKRMFDVYAGRNWIHLENKGKVALARSIYSAMRAAGATPYDDVAKDPLLAKL